jgi:hypothetical protein
MRNTRFEKRVSLDSSAKAGIEGNGVTLRREHHLPGVGLASERD